MKGKDFCYYSGIYTCAILGLWVPIPCDDRLLLKDLGCTTNKLYSQQKNQTWVKLHLFTDYWYFHICFGIYAGTEDVAAMPVWFAPQVWHTPIVVTTVTIETIKLISVALCVCGTTLIVASYPGSLRPPRAWVWG